MNKFYPLLNEEKEMYNNKSAVKKIRMKDMAEVVAPDGSVVNLDRIKRQIKQIKTLIVAQDQLFSPFVYELEDVYTWGVPTMGTDGNWLFINPKFAEKLTFDQCTFVIYHELFHCLLDHMKRGKYGGYNHHKFNRAADYEINAIFADTYHDEYNIKELYSGALMGILYDEKFLNVPAEAIYQQIDDDPEDFKPKTSKDGMSSDDEGKDSNDNGEENDQYSQDNGSKNDPYNRKFSAGEMSKASESDIRTQTEVAKNAGSRPGAMIDPEMGKKIAEAAGHSESELGDGKKTAEDWSKKSRELLNRAINQNKMSGGGRGNMLAKILGDHHNSVIDWKRILSRYVGEIMSKKDQTWALPNKRYMAQNPNAIRISQKFTGKEIHRIVVCMDTSGSMERQLIQGIVDEINAILFARKIKEIIVLFFDTEVKEPQIIKQGARAYCPNVTGGGGTDFQVPLDFIKQKYNDNLSLCLFFTDGFEDIPKKPKYDRNFIWIVYNNPNWPNSAHVGGNPPFGKKILVNTKSLEAGVKNKVSESLDDIKKVVMESIKYYVR